MSVMQLALATLLAVLSLIPLVLKKRNAFNAFRAQDGLDHSPRVLTSDKEQLLNQLKALKM